MAIESFLKVDERDPDWAHSPNEYIGKQFKVIDANCLQVNENLADSMILRLNPTENTLLCKNLQIIGRDASQLNLYIMCEGSEKTEQVFLYNVVAEPNSTLNIGVFVKNGKLNKHIFECEANENAVINIIGIAENDEGGTSEIIAKVFHAGPNAESNQMINCISGKNSRTVYQGVVKIMEDMVDSYTTIANSSIITDDTGQAFSIPELIIDCGKVEASQSCDIGQFDQEQLWYLRSRGVALEDAKKILINAHQDSVLNFILDTEIRDELKDFFRG
jgi:Fe-S cluster assembly protein SufD